MREIKRYIEFAIENGYKSGYVMNKKFSLSYNHQRDLCISIAYEYKSTNIEKVLMSKEFIDAIARGVDKRDVFIKVDGIEVGLKDQIAMFQALAIRDNTLPEFITNLIPKE